MAHNFNSARDREAPSSASYKISVERNQQSIEQIEHNRLSIEPIESQSNAIEYYLGIGHSIEIRLRSTIELQLFNPVRLQSSLIAIFV